MKDIEGEIVAMGLTAPRVTLADVQAEIVKAYYFTAEEGVGHTCEPQLSLMTFCVLVLSNGFTVTGQSACISPENFNAEIGRKIARQKAEDRVWELLGFRLQDRLHHAPAA